MKKSNPMEAYRKEQKKKEIQKNKAKQSNIKAIQDLLNDPAKIDGEIAKVQAEYDTNRLDASYKIRLKELNQMKSVAIQKQKILLLKQGGGTASIATSQTAYSSSSSSQVSVGHTKPYAQQQQLQRQQYYAPQQQLQHQQYYSSSKIPGKPPLAVGGQFGVPLPPPRSHVTTMGGGIPPPPPRTASHLVGAPPKNHTTVDRNSKKWKNDRSNTSMVDDPLDPAGTSYVDRYGKEQQQQRQQQQRLQHQQQQQQQQQQHHHPQQQQHQQQQHRQQHQQQIHPSEPSSSLINASNPMKEEATLSAEELMLQRFQMPDDDEDDDDEDDDDEDDDDEDADDNDDDDNNDNGGSNDDNDDVADESQSKTHSYTTYESESAPVYSAMYSTMYNTLSAEEILKRRSQLTEEEGDNVCSDDMQYPTYTYAPTYTALSAEEIMNRRFQIADEEEVYGGMDKSDEASSAVPDVLSILGGYGDDEDEPDQQETVVYHENYNRCVEATHPQVITQSAVPATTQVKVDSKLTAFLPSSLRAKRPATATAAGSKKPKMHIATDTNTNAAAASANSVDSAYSEFLDEISKIAST